MSWLIEPLGLPFMQTALLAAVLIGITCAALGVYVVLRGMAFIGDALAHTTLPGLVIAFLAGLDLTLGALLSAVVTAAAIGWFSRREEIREDTAIGIFFTAAFALGVALISGTRSFRDLSQFLFGYILGVTPTDLLILAGVALTVLVVLWLLHKELELSSFDPAYAEAIGARPELLRYVLLGLLALTVVAAVQAVGVVLTNALLVTPAAAASLLTRKLTRMMALGAGFALLSTVLGLYASYYARISTGAAIVLACSACFLAAWVVSTSRARVLRH